MIDTQRPWIYITTNMLLHNSKNVKEAAAAEKVDIRKPLEEVLYKFQNTPLKCVTMEADITTMNYSGQCMRD